MIKQQLLQCTTASDALLCILQLADTSYHQTPVATCKKRIHCTADTAYTACMYMLQCRDTPFHVKLPACTVAHSHGMHVSHPRSA